MLLLPFLAVGTLGFWALLVISAVFISILIDEDRSTGATFCALLTLVILCVLGNLNPLTLIQEHLLIALASIPAYFFIGVIWGRAKWDFYLIKMRAKLRGLAEAFKIDQVKSLKELDIHEKNYTNPNNSRDFNRNNNVEELLKNIETKREHIKSNKGWENFIQARGFSKSIPLNVKDHKAQILGWMSLWPASMLCTLLNDPIRKVFEVVYERVSGSFQEASNRKFQDFSLETEK